MEIDKEFKCKTVNYFETDDQEIDQLVFRHWPQLNNEFGYEFACEELGGNGSLHTFTIDGDIDAYEEKLLKDAIASGTSRGYLTRVLLNALARLEILAKGNYLVRCG